MSVAFWTNTTLDIRAITMMGLSAKPNSTDPIGKFGTGMKLAIAVLLRLGAGVELYIKGQKYLFKTRTDDFRGQEYDQILMYKTTITGRLLPTKLSFTTHLGSHWQPWMAFRELLSNTVDEDGLVFGVDGMEVSHVGLGSLAGLEGSEEVTTTTATLPSPEGAEKVDRGSTAYQYYKNHGTFWVISGDVFDELLQEYVNGESTVFLNTGNDKPIYEDAVVTIWDRPSKYLYFKGIRVYEMRYEANLTYNFKAWVELTEDRTAGNIWELQYYLAGAIRYGIHDEDLLRKLMTRKDEPRYEDSDLGFHYENKTSLKRKEEPNKTPVLDDTPFLRVAASIKSPTPSIVIVKNAVERKKTEAQSRRLEFNGVLWEHVGKALKDYSNVGDLSNEELKHWKKLLENWSEDDVEDDVIF